MLEARERVAEVEVEVGHRDRASLDRAMRIEKPGCRGVVPRVVVGEQPVDERAHRQTVVGRFRRRRLAARVNGIPARGRDARKQFMPGRRCNRGPEFGVRARLVEAPELQQSTRGADQRAGVP